MSKQKAQAPEVISKAAAARKIVAVAQEIHDDIVKKRKKPAMSFPVRSLANVKYDAKRGHFEILGKRATRTLSYNTVKAFAQSMRLLATTKNDLLDRDDIAGKREVYYNSKGWGECRFDEQPESDALLDDMEAMLGVNREQLGYIPEERGGDGAPARCDLGNLKRPLAGRLALHRKAPLIRDRYPVKVLHRHDYQ